VGPTVAGALARTFGDLDSVVAADEDELRTVPDVGPTVATEIREFFDAEGNRAVIAALREHGVEHRSADADGGDELAGLTFVFTGSLEGYTRSEVQDLVERHGGSATSSVSSNTEYLVVGENPGTTKREDAAGHGVPRLDEEEFEALLDERGV